MESKRLLFEPLQVGTMRLKNRIVALPTAPGYYDTSHSPTERMVAMYRRRALGGAALVNVGIAFVEPYEISRPGVLGFYSDMQVPHYDVLVDAIHQGGSRATLQVTDRWHEDFPYEMDDLSVRQIESMIDHYVRAAVRARMVGFDGLCLEVAHGWPLARFISPLTNHRHDRYGDFTYVPSQILKRVRAEVGQSLVLMMRLSVIDDLDSGQGVTLQQSINELCPAFEVAGVEMLDLTFGLGPVARNVKQYLATETIYTEPGDKLQYFKAVKDTVAVPVVGRSRVNDPEMAEKAVQEGWVDLIGMARQLLADPDFPAKTEERCYDEIRRCIMCSFCNSAQGPGLATHCAINGAVGRELEEDHPLRSIRRPKRALVVGAGVSGMEVSLGLADRGWKVTLIERANGLGGILQWVAQLPHLRLLDLMHAVTHQSFRLAHSSVDVHLSTEFSVGYPTTDSADVLVLATGSRPFSLPASPSSGPSVCTYLDYLQGAEIGERVVVDGRGEGVEFAVSIARTGRQVTLIEATPRLQPLVYDYGLRRVEPLRDYLAGEHVTSLWSSRVREISEGGVVIERRNGKLEPVAADTLVIAGRQPAPFDIARGLDGNLVVYQVGDCVRPRGLGEVLEEARALVNTLAA